MSLVSSFYHNKIACENKARTFDASEKFYLTQAGVWDDAYHTAQSECLGVVDALSERKSEEHSDDVVDAYAYCIDLIERRLISGVDN